MEDPHGTEEHHEGHVSEALRMLALAVGALLLLRSVHFAVDQWIWPVADSDAGRAMAPFRAGYLLAHGQSMPMVPMDLPGRLGMAALLALVFAGGTGAVTMAIARSMNAHPRRWALRAGRAMLLVSWVVLSLSAVLWPARTLQVKEEGIVLVHRTALPGGLGLPFGARWVGHPWDAVAPFEPHPTPEGWQLLLTMQGPISPAAVESRAIASSPNEEQIGALASALESQRKQTH